MKNKIVCIGNSITNGFPFKRSQSFPSLIRLATGFEVINKGNNGESTSQLLERFTHDVLDHKPDLLTILTGTNDFIFSTDTVAGVFEKILKMIELAKKQGIKVLLMTPLLTDSAMAKATWMTAADIDYFKVNDQLKEIGLLIKEYSLENATLKDKDIMVLDLQELYCEFENRVSTENAFHDGLHPTVLGQEFIADTLVKALEDFSPRT